MTTALHALHPSGGESKKERFLPQHCSAPSATLFGNSEWAMKAAQSGVPSFNGGACRRVVRCAIARTNGGL